MTLALAAPAGISAHELSMDDASAVLDIVYTKVPYYPDTIQLAGEGSYAVAFWAPAKGHPAGTVLAKKSAGNWSLVKLIGANLKDPVELETLGVPATDANALIADIQRAANG